MPWKDPAPWFGSARSEPRRSAITAFTERPAWQRYSLRSSAPRKAFVRAGRSQVPSGAASGSSVDRLHSDIGTTPRGSHTAECERAAPTTRTDDRFRTLLRAEAGPGGVHDGADEDEDEDADDDDAPPRRHGGGDRRN